MKNYILVILFIVLISCKTDKHKDPFKNKKTIKKTVNQVYIDDKNDTIKSQTSYLKNSYKLIIFPTLDKNKEKINFRLIKGKKDNTYLLGNTFIANYMRYFKGIDFNNYFALHGNGGGTSNFYFWLYNKETGEEVLTGIEVDFDLKNELILYIDEDDEYNNYIYDVNTKVKTLIDIPSELLDKQECTKYNDTYKTLCIKRVTNKYYYLGFRRCEPSSVGFKVKKSQ